MHLKVTVVGIRGHCPVYQEGDAFHLKDGYIIDPEVSCPICMHSLASILPYYNAIYRGADPVALGLSPNADRAARVQCLDPCTYTGGGTVILEIIKVRDDEITRTG